LTALLFGALALGCSSGGAGPAGTGGSSPGPLGTGGGAGPAGTGGSQPAGTGGNSAPGSGGDSGSAGASGTGGGATGGRAVVDGGAGQDGGRSSDGGLPDGGGNDGDGRIDIQSPFKADPAQRVAAGVPRGRRVDFTMSSMGSQYYPTASGAAFTRKGAVYLPAGYAGTEVPFMVVQDGISGIGYVNTMPNALDNLINEKRIPAMAVIFIDPGPDSGERSREYDTVSDAYTKFVEGEVLPAAKAAVKSQAQLDPSLTSNPDGRGSMGGSSGGACAFTMGWFHPELYRRIVTYSGSFTKLARSTMYADGAAEYYEHLIPATDAKPLRVFLASGTNDLNNQFGVWLDANDAMFAALTAKGYHVRYIRATGATHVDGGVLGQTLADTLVWVWRGYPIN